MTRDATATDQEPFVLSPYEWLVEVGNDDVDSDDDSPKVERPSHRDENDTLTSLEALSDEVSAAILSYLTLYEISQCSVVSQRMKRACRSNSLWKGLFCRRWNVADCTNIDAAVDYVTCYAAAHAHPHDLWMTHWNCVYPSMHNLSPGRCYIPDADDTPKKHGHHGPRHDACRYCDACPTCRLNEWSSNTTFPTCTCSSPRKDSGTCTQAARVMARVSSQLHPTIPHCRPTAHQSRRAFRTAATFHRTLRLEQYEQQPLVPTNFLTDLLFFNVTDPTTTDGQWELDQLVHESHSDTTPRAAPSDTQDAHLWETSHHSWHTVRLFNPDFVRPILFRVGIMRQDCFSVYPSEGWIAPGQCCYVTFGVRTLGSALAYAFEGLNVHREGLDGDWSDVYTEQAHLPMAPFLVRYQYCVAHPVVGPTTTARPWATHAASTTTRRATERLLAFYKQQAAKMAPHHVRSIYVSAHVNAHYHFSDFAAATCHPWHVTLDSQDGPVVLSPVLREEYPALYQRLQDGITCSCDTPCVWNTCHSCDRKWQLRSEEFLQAYLVAHMQWSSHRQQREKQLNNTVRCIALLNSPEGLSGSASNLSALLQVACGMLQSWRGSRWITKRRAQTLIRLELLVDQAYRQIPVGGADWIPWRLSGVYPHSTSTSSVFECDSTLDHEPCSLHGNLHWKVEPEHLDLFRHLAHNPGAYCLGPQEDPNHLEDTIVQVTSRYFRRKVGCVTDIFGDNAVTALQAGICMIQDPRSLMVHGIYDMIPYPGFLVTRPKLDKAAVKNLTVHTEHEGSLQGERFAYYWVQEGLDLRHLVPYASSCQTHDLDFAISTPFSLHMYLHGNPSANAIGALCSAASSEELPFRPELEAMFVVNTDERLEAQVDDIEAHAIIAQIPGRRRLLQRFWDMGTLLGLVASEQHDGSTVFVERNILIVLQNAALSCMAAPLWLSLVARYYHWLPTEPLDYSLNDLPFSVTPNRQMRFLTVEECGMVAVMTCFAVLALARWAERHTARDYSRIILESMPDQDGFYARLMLRYHRKWDSICPLFFQRRIFTPAWNRRSHSDLLKRIAHCRHPTKTTTQPYIKASSIKRDDHSVFGDSRDEGLDIGITSLTLRAMAAVLGAVCCFCSSTPHVWLNAITVLFGGVGLGMSVSISSLTNGFSSIEAWTNGWPILKSYDLATYIMTGSLVGHLIGSSGGILFVVEFVLTFGGLFLGGIAGTIAFGSRESWGCLCMFSTTAFFGYILGRVAVLDGARYRQRCYASFLLSRMVVVWFILIPFAYFAEWESPVSVMVTRLEPSLRDWPDDALQWSRIAIAHKLQ